MFFIKYELERSGVRKFSAMRAWLWWGLPNRRLLQFTSETKAYDAETKSLLILEIMNTHLDFLVSKGLARKGCLSWCCSRAVCIFVIINIAKNCRKKDMRYWGVVHTAGVWSFLDPRRIE